jgi:hypothetical protein
VNNEWQLALQAWQVHERFPDERIKVRNYFIRHGIASDWKEMQPYDYDEAVRRVKLVYDRMQDTFASKAFKANPGGHCDYCPVAQACDVYRGLSDGKNKIASQDDAFKQMGEIVVARAAADNLTKALKAWVDANGPVALPDGLTASYKQPAASLTLSNMEKAYEAIGEELFEIVKPDARKLKKLTDDPRLDGLWEVSQGKPRFSIGEVKE